MVALRELATKKTLVGAGWFGLSGLDSLECRLGEKK